MQYKLKMFLLPIAIATIIFTIVIGLLNFNVKAQTQDVKEFARFPFTGTYRITSYVDHNRPELNNKDGNIIVFNGLTYNDCYVSDIWTPPYCYDSHTGIDWGVPTNTLILSSASGEVIQVGFDAGGYGRFIRIDHDNGFETVYAHLTSTLVSVNDFVDKGEAIGYSGNTGNSTAPHLHFEVRYTNTLRPTDPFGWQSKKNDPIANYSGARAVCLWTDKNLCSDIIIEDGDIDNSGTITETRFERIGSNTEWFQGQGNSLRMQYVENGDGSLWAYWRPRLKYPGPYEIFTFVPSIVGKTVVTYTIYDKEGEHVQMVNQAIYTNEWVSLGSYHFRSGFFDYIKLTNLTGDSQGTKYVVFDTMKFRSYFVYLPLTLKNYYPDTYEPNNDFSSAFEIVPDQTYLSYINPITDEDWFKSSVTVPVNKERVIEVDLSSIPVGANYDLALYDEINNLLAESTNNGNTDENISELVSKSGSYRIKVYSVSEFSRAEGYSLQLRVGVAGIPKTEQE